MDPTPLRGLLDRYAHRADARALLGALAASPERGVPLHKLRRHVSAGQFALVRLLDSLEAARLVRVVNIDGHLNYGLASIPGLAALVERMNRI